MQTKIRLMLCHGRDTGLISIVEETFDGAEMRIGLQAIRELAAQTVRTDDHITPGVSARHHGARDPAHRRLCAEQQERRQHEPSQDDLAGEELRGLQRESEQQQGATDEQPFLEDAMAKPAIEPLPGTVLIQHGLTEDLRGDDESERAERQILCLETLAVEHQAGKQGERDDGGVQQLAQQRDSRRVRRTIIDTQSVGSYTIEQLW
jgi:hypothetical protein